MSAILALIVTPGPLEEPPPSAPWSAELRRIPTTLEAMQQLVGGYIEAIRPLQGMRSWTGWVNEEGLYDPACLPNPVGSAFARAHGWYPAAILRGTVVFVGANGGPEDIDLPDHIVTAAREFFGPDLKETP